MPVLRRTARGVFCSGCEADFLPPGLPRCARCAAPAGLAPARCGACLRDPPSFDATVALGTYAPPFAQFLLALKAAERLDLAPPLGRALAERARQRFAQMPAGACVIPMPMSLPRLRERGYNPALEIAAPLARALGLPLATGLAWRLRHGPPQQSLPARQRRAYVRGAFHASAQVRGTRILVVDDVMTTGASLDALAGALKAAGALEVFNLVAARTP